jgi:hypothetical protein
MGIASKSEKEGSGSLLLSNRSSAPTKLRDFRSQRSGVDASDASFLPAWTEDPAKKEAGLTSELKKRVIDSSSRARPAGIEY